jgi:hypothetical protein
MPLKYLVFLFLGHFIRPLFGFGGLLDESIRAHGDVLHLLLILGKETVFISLSVEVDSF